jgi:hypothetical protein
LEPILRKQNKIDLEPRHVEQELWHQMVGYKALLLLLFQQLQSLLKQFLPHFLVSAATTS